MSRHSGGYHHKTASRLPGQDGPAGVQDGTLTNDVKEDRFQQRVLSVGAAQQNQRQSRMFLKQPLKSSQDEKDNMLDIVNKVEMFRIVTEKINTQLQL